MIILICSFLIFFSRFLILTGSQIIYINENYLGVPTGTSQQPFSSLKDFFYSKPKNFSEILLDSNISCSESLVNEFGMMIQLIL